MERDRAIEKVRSSEKVTERLRSTNAELEANIDSLKQQVETL